MKKTILALALAAGLTSFAGNAKAQNLIQNGNFATGDFTGWSNNSIVLSPFSTPAITLPGSDAYYAYTKFDGYISQTISTSIGQGYTLSFIANNNSNNIAAGADIDASINGVGLFTNTANLSIVSSWTLQAYNFTATSGSTTLQINMNFSPASGSGYIDDISVAAVPEPSTCALFGLGALALVIAARMKKA